MDMTCHDKKLGFTKKYFNNVTADKAIKHQTELG